MAKEPKNEAPQGRSLFGGSGTGAEGPETELSHEVPSRKSEEAKASKRAARAQKSEAGKVASKRFMKSIGDIASAPVRGFKASVAQNPVRTWSITAGLLVVGAFGTLQAINLYSAIPHTALNAYLDAVRDADTSKIESLEVGQTAELDWAPAEVLKETTLPAVSQTELDWTVLSGDAVAVVKLEGFESELKFGLVRETSFGFTGWTHTWMIESDPVTISFELDSALDPGQQLVIGDTAIGTSIDETAVTIASNEFRALPGLLSVGVAPNGFIGGPTEVYELTPGASQTLTFAAGGTDMALVERATELASESLLAQFDDCLEAACGVLDNNWDDYYLSWTLGDPPEYWEARTATDSLTSDGCELVIDGTLNGPFTVDYVFMCGYNIVRDAEWDLGDGYVISDQGTIAVGRGIGISVTASTDGSELTPGVIRYVPYGTD
jgi:hypothetical protein